MEKGKTLPEVGRRLSAQYGIRLGGSGNSNAPGAAALSSFNALSYPRTDFGERFFFGPLAVSSGAGR